MEKIKDIKSVNKCLDWSESYIDIIALLSMCIDDKISIFTVPLIVVVITGAGVVVRLKYFAAIK